MARRERRSAEQGSSRLRTLEVQSPRRPRRRKPTHVVRMLEEAPRCSRQAFGGARRDDGLAARAACDAGVSAAVPGPVECRPLTQGYHLTRARSFTKPTDAESEASRRFQDSCPVPSPR